MVVKTKILAVPPDGSGGDAAYREAASLLQKGELVAFPSETVYGLGGDACRLEAVEAIFRVKGRPSDNPLIVHVASAEQALEFGVALDSRFTKLADTFWPGPLTLVLPLKASCQAITGKGLGTIALRVPGHPVALRLIRESGLALAAPSANLSGKPSPTTAQHVAQDLTDRVALILDGGPCRVGIESTVLDLSTSRSQILRPGSIDAASLAKMLGEPVELAKSEAVKLKSPGTRYQHYQPNAAVWILPEEMGPVLWSSFQKCIEQSGLRWGYAGMHHLSNPDVPRVTLQNTEESYAEGFYRALRWLDDRQVQVILIDSPPASSAALWDRLSRAAQAKASDIQTLKGLIAQKK